MSRTLNALTEAFDAIERQQIREISRKRREIEILDSSLNDVDEIEAFEMRELLTRESNAHHC